MASNRLVSIIMPAYNTEQTLSQSVDSVLMQTYKDFELIIVNDGSTDGTSEILDKVSDDRIRIINILNSGPSAARNQGIEYAKGEYLSFIDSDDLWTKDKLEKQLIKLKSNPRCDVVYSWTILIDQNGNYIHPIKSVSYEGNVYEKMLINNFIGSGSNILATKKSVETAGFFNEELKFGEEWDLLIRLSRKCKFVVVKEYQIYYRQNINSLSSSVEEMEIDSLKVIELAYRNAPHEYLKLKNKSIACLNSYLSYLYLTRQTGENWRINLFSKAVKSIILDPISFRNVKAISLIFLSIFFYIVPKNKSIYLIDKMLKLYGRHYKWENMKL